MPKKDSTMPIHERDTALR